MRIPLSWTQVFLMFAVLGATATASQAAKRHIHRPHHPAQATTRPKPASPSPAPAPAASADDEIESVEVDPAPAATAAAEASDHLTSKQWLAHLHPAVVHLPIAWSLLWLMAEAAGFFGLGSLATAARPLGWLTVASFVPAVISGLLHVDELPQDPESLHPAIVHRNIMYATLATALALAAVNERWARSRQPSRGARGAFLAALSAQAAAIGVGAHLGGKLVYGDSYLPFF